MTSAAGSAPAIRFVLIIWLAATLLIAALVVLLPLHLEALGFDVDATAIAVGAAGVGGVLSAEPIGRLANRLGSVHLIRLGIVVMATSVVAIGLLEQLWAFVALHALIGVGTAAVRVGAQMVVRNQVTDERRGRVHGTQGLMTRIVSLLVPVGIGFLWEQRGAEPSFIVPALLAGAGLLLTAHVGFESPAPPPDGDHDNPFTVRSMLRIATGPILFQAARGGRMLLLPLIGLEIGLSPGRIGLLVGLTAAADVLVSPISGPVMDGRGRLATIVPSFSLMALGFVLLGLGGGWLLIAAAIVLGIGNGLSSGLLLTLGSDLAPADREGQFLGRFGALNDIGRLIGPFLVGVLGRLLGLEAAAFSLAVVAVAALACVLLFIGETRPAPAA
jgi:MFS family permease